ncbi:MAG: carboxypeptidase-like regulatory domain-containing protein [Archangium sp.]|nr:carboxypeptidase-like regulatory domain-containing protein [Archangium sp.]
MTAVNRKTLWAASALLALSLTACPVPPPPCDGGACATGGGGGSSAECVEDSDCPDPQFFFCNTVTSQCEPSCRSAAQCNPASVNNGVRPPAYALDFCTGSLGCQCDEGKCVGSLCSADSDCGSLVCRSGACVTPPAATAVAKCTVSPDFAVFKQGSKARFWVSAWDASNNPIVIKDGATFTAVGSALTLTGTGTGHFADFTAANATVTTPTASVQASFGTVNCQAKAIVLANPAAGEVAVSVIDELSGRPVPGAKVMLSSTAGAIIQQGANDTVDTDAQGYAVLSGIPAAYSVSVFHPEFSYVTVANYAGTSRFLSFAIRRNSLDKYGGYKGGFTNVPMSSNVHAALAGMSLAGSITNLNLTALLGPSVPTDIKIGSAINEMGVGIPAGAYLGFGDQKIKDDIAGQGLNGTCLDGAGQPDEARIAAGTCGTRTAWALAGDVPLGDLPIDAVAGGLDNINIGALLGRIVPIFKKFNSSVVRDVQYTLRPTPILDGGAPDFTDQSQYTVANHDFTQIPLAFNFVVKMPTLPQYKSSFVDAVAIIGGASAVGRGVVPLGIGVGVNTMPVDGQIDRLEPGGGAPTIAAGNIGVRMAPTHHGLEGAHYGLLIAAISAKGLTDASAGVGASALFPRLPGNKMVFDPAGSTPVDISTQVFPIYPEGAKFNYAGANDGAVPARSFRIGATPTTPVPGVNVIRVSFADAIETRWDILVDAAAPGFTVPPVPGTLRDRLFANNVAGGTRSDLLVQAFRMTKDPLVTTSPAVSFTDYVELNDTNADRTTDFLTAFSFLSYGKPTIEFKTPSANPATIVAGSKIVVSVGGFSIGTTPGTNDGVVRLSFTGGPAACATVVLSTEVPMAGSGDLEHTLPAGCVGAGIGIRAELLKVDSSTPINPAVATTITATIN